MEIDVDEFVNEFIGKVNLAVVHVMLDGMIRDGNLNQEDQARAEWARKSLQDYRRTLKSVDGG